MARLNIERQKELEPIRIARAQQALENLGFEVMRIDDNTLEFQFKDSVIKFYPYSGWATGSTIIDGRGFDNLLKQLK